MCQRISKNIQKIMADRKNRTRYPGYLNTLPPHICYMQAANNSETPSLYVLGSFRKKKITPSTELNKFLSKRI